MKRKFGNLLMTATLVLAVGAFFTSCRDHDEELIAVMDAQAQTLEEVNQALADAKEELKDAVESAQGSAGVSIDSLGAVIDALEDRIAVLEGTNYDHSGFATKQELEDSIAAVRAELENAIQELANAKADKAALDEVADSLEALKGDFEDHVTFFTTWSQTVEDALVRLDSLSLLDARIKALEDAKFQEQIDAIWGDLKPLMDQVAAVDARSKYDSIRIDALEAFDIEISQALKDSIAAVRAEAAANLAAAKEYADAAAAAVAEELAKTNATVAQLQEAFDQAVAELQDQIDVLQEEVDELAYVVDELAETVEEMFEELAKEIEDVKEYLNKQITSVVLQGAYSPVVGYFSLPTGVKSNILAAYYGEADTDFYFPTARTANNVGAAFDEAAFTAMGFAEELNKAGVIIGGNGNAGKLYLTINPAEVEVTADQLVLVNSLGEKAPATFTDLKISTDKLVFGYTRAGAVSLYEAEATIAAEDVEAAKLRIELSELKDAIKDVVSLEDGVSVSNVVTALYTVVNDLADAQAVQATWTDAEGVDHTVYSDYGLAAVAVKPLSYNFLADLDVDAVPGYHKVMNVVNRVFDKVGVITIPDLGLSSLKASLDSIKFGGAIGDSLKFNVKYAQTITKDIPFSTSVDVTVDIPLKDIVIDLEVPIEGSVIKTGAYDLDGKEIIVTVPADTVTVKHTIKKEDIAAGSTSTTVDINEVITVEIPVEFEVPVAIATKDVLGDLGNTLSNLDELMAQVNGMLADVEGKIESVEGQLNEALAKVQSKLNTYLDKANNKLCSMINSFNAVLQPTMLVTTTNGFSMLSSMKGAPTAIDAASAVLVPTSFTAEFLAPACKKFVAVTNAYDADGNEDLDAAKAANTGDFATVLPGETRTVQFNGKAGYTYEITYSACDFYGMISNTKYYVRVK